MTVSKLHVESCLGISINRLNRCGCISREKLVTGQLHWGADEEPRATVGLFSHKGDWLRLKYLSAGCALEQVIPLRWTPCHYGKERPWFACPVCSRRVGRLFLRSRRFACRHCQRLCYASQLENVGQRGIGMYHKLVNSITNEKGEYEKPSRMHWKTFYQLISRLENTDTRLLASGFFRG